LRRARDILLDAAGVLEVQTYGDQLRIFARDGDGMIARLRDILAAQDIQVKDARRTSPRMEEAFISLIRQRMTEGI